ncbi:2-oxoacid:acceptor oxidoreductase subunit alpha [Nanoarchaeota archaeon]
MKEVVNELNWKIGGEAGMGILNAGMLFAKITLRGGLWSVAHAIYPSLIRGGHNHLDVHVGEEKVFSHRNRVDVLVALNRETFDIHKDLLSSGAGVIFDNKEYAINHKELPRDDIKLIDVPLLELSNKNGGKILRNTVAIGATIALVDYDLNLFNEALKLTFSRKGEKVVDMNIKAAKAGYDWVKSNYGNGFGYKLKRLKSQKRIFVSGNESVSLGAVKAGAKFMAAYPMTPATSVMINLNKWAQEFGIVIKQTEDELAAMNMTIGANYAGVRALTATSGGGFALMTEAFGLASMTETPIVAIEVQRPGPATGMATQSGQGDLHFVLNASPDDFPRIVIAPGDVKECYEDTFNAFNLAEKYQLPVVVMLDKYLGESHWTTDEFGLEKLKIERGKLLTNQQAEKQKNYLRYKLTEDGVSPRSVPGQNNCMYTASSYEHNEEGHENEEEEVRISMAEKRYKKLDAARADIPEPELVGDKNADITIIGWGSTKNGILEAMKDLRKEDIKVNYLQIKYIFPLPEKTIIDVIKKARKTVLVENNQTGQLGLLIRKFTGLSIDHKILKFDGRPFFPKEIIDGIKKIK